MEVTQRMPKEDKEVHIYGTLHQIVESVCDQDWKQMAIAMSEIFILIGKEMKKQREKLNEFLCEYTDRLEIVKNDITYFGESAFTLANRLEYLCTQFERIPNIIESEDLEELKSFVDEVTVKLQQIRKIAEDASEEMSKGLDRLLELHNKTKQLENEIKQREKWTSYLQYFFNGTALIVPSSTVLIKFSTSLISASPQLVLFVSCASVALAFVAKLQTWLDTTEEDKTM